MAAGQDYVESENGLDTITKNNVNAVVVRSTDASREQDDVTIQLTWNGKTVPSRTLTVSAPSHIEQTPNRPRNPDDSAFGGGFMTVYYYRILDMLEGPLPAEVELNESF